MHSTKTNLIPPKTAALILGTSESMLHYWRSKPGKGPKCTVAEDGGLFYEMGDLVTWSKAKADAAKQRHGELLDRVALLKNSTNGGTRDDKDKKRNGRRAAAGEAARASVAR